MPPSLLSASQMCDDKQEPHALGTAGVHKCISLLIWVVPPFVLCSCHIWGHQICNILQMLVLFHLCEGLLKDH